MFCESEGSLYCPLLTLQALTRPTCYDWCGADPGGGEEKSCLPLTTCDIPGFALLAGPHPVLILSPNTHLTKSAATAQLARAVLLELRGTMAAALTVQIRWGNCGRKPSRSHGTGGAGL